MMVSRWRVSLCVEKWRGNKGSDGEKKKLVKWPSTYAILGIMGGTVTSDKIITEKNG